MKNIKCLVGLHKYKYLGVSEYSYSTGVLTITEVRGKVYQCELCGKINAPWWWDKSERDLKPYCTDIECKGWKEDVKTIPESDFGNTSRINLN